MHIPMHNVAESEILSRYVSDYWMEDEREAFSVWIANTITSAMSYAALAAVAKYAGQDRVVESLAVFV